MKKVLMVVLLGLVCSCDQEFTVSDDLDIAKGQYVCKSSSDSELNRIRKVQRDKDPIAYYVTYCAAGPVISTPQDQWNAINDPLVQFYYNRIMDRANYKICWRNTPEDQLYKCDKFLPK